MKRKQSHVIVDDWGKRPIDVASPDPGLNDWKKQRQICGDSFGNILRCSDRPRRTATLPKGRDLAKRTRVRKSVSAFWPPWVHPSASMMTVVSLNVPIRSLTVSNGDGATFTLRYRDSAHHGDTSGRVWDLTFYLCDQDRTVSTHWNGFLTEGQVRNAFLGTMSVEVVCSLRDPGYYYRHGPWLSIPVKGTGERNSPVLGVFLTPEIQSAVLSLLDG